MKVVKSQTDTYTISGMRDLDVITVYCINHCPGRGEITISCFCEAWSYLWTAMGPTRSIQQFFTDAETDYLVMKLLDGADKYETDWGKINLRLEEAGCHDIQVWDELEAMSEAATLTEYLGDDWETNLPKRLTRHYTYLNQVVEAVKAALKETL